MYIYKHTQAYIYILYITCRQSASKASSALLLITTFKSVVIKYFNVETLSHLLSFVEYTCKMQQLVSHLLSMI